MSRGEEEGDGSSCGFGAASTITGRGVPQIEAIRTDGPWTQQEQQDGGQQSG